MIVQVFLNFLIAAINTIVSEGQILYQINEDARCNYETRVIKLYFDFQKYEAEYYSLMHKTILEGKKEYYHKNYQFSQL